MSDAPIPYAGSNLAKPDGFNEGVDFALSVIRERIREWKRKRQWWETGPGVIETELVSLKKRILAQRRAGT